MRRPDDLRSQVAVVRVALVALLSLACVASPAVARIRYEGKELSEREVRMLMRTSVGVVLPIWETKNLDVSEAKLISSHAAGCNLRGLESLSEEVAAVIAQSRGEIWLDGLEQVPPGVARILAKSMGTLSLGGLKSLESPELALKLALQGGRISLPGITSVSSEIADELSKARSLSLPSLERLDHQELASKLEVTEGALHLPYVAELTPAGAEGLLSRPGLRLHLPALETLDLPTSRVLSRHESVLDLDGIRMADADVLTYIFQCTGPIDLGALKSLGPTPLPTGLLAAIEQHRAPITLSGLTELSPELARAIRGRTSHTHLGGLSSISDDVVNELLNCRGTIWLTGLESTGSADELVQQLLQQPEQGTVAFVLPIEMVGRLSPDVRGICNTRRVLAFGNTVGK